MALNPKNVSNKDHIMKKLVEEKEFIENFQNKINSILKIFKIIALMSLSGVGIYLIFLWNFSYY